MKKILAVTALLVLMPALALADTAKHDQNQNKSDYRSSSDVRSDRNSDDMRGSLREEKQEDKRDATDTLRKATAVYRDIVLSSPHGAVPKNVQSNAKCVAVFPNTITAAVGVGGTRGEGVVSCRNNGKWSAPAIASLTAGSLGAQIGGKSTDLVLFINSQDAVSALKRGSMRIGADASVDVGSYDASKDFGPSGIVAYQRSSGGYLGASLTAGNISLSDDDNRALYGKNISSAKLMDGIEMPKSSEAENFRNILPNA